MDSSSPSTILVICVGTILSIMFVLGVFGNVLVCFAVYRNRRLRTVTNIYVLSLALVDLLELLLSRPFGIAAAFLGRWPFWDGFCQFNGFLVYYWIAVSISTLAFTAVNRYLCLIKPEIYKGILTKTTTTRTLISLWISVFLLGLAISLSARFHFEYSSNVLFCRALVDDRPTQLTFLVCSIFFTFIPMAMIFCCYGRVYLAIRQHLRRVSPALGVPNTNQNLCVDEIKTTRLLFTTVAAFYLSWTPLTFVSLMWYSVKLSPSAIPARVSSLCAAASSFINPIIYGVMNRAMRKEFVRILWGWKNTET